MRSRIFRVEPESRSVSELAPTTFAEAGFLETKDIHEWLANHPGILGENLLVIQREHVGVEGSRRRPDIVAVDTDGNLVVVEAKRDDSGNDVYWQAALYAASYWPRSANDVIDMFASYAEIERTDALQRLIDHTSAEDEADLIATLNANQRIILVSKEFPKEVTTTILWLERHGVDISCLQLTPHRDLVTGSYYIQSSYIIPVPETKDLMVEMRRTQQERDAQAADVGTRRADEITQFMFAIRDKLKVQLAENLLPSRTNRWSGVSGTQRYLKYWYMNNPWTNGYFCFATDLETEPGDPNEGQVHVNFYVWTTLALQKVDQDQLERVRVACKSLHGVDGFGYNETPAAFRIGKWVQARPFDGDNAETIAVTLGKLIKSLFPIIDGVVAQEPSSQQNENSGRTGKKK